MKRNRNKYDFAFKENAVLLSYKVNCLSKLEKKLGLYAGALSQWRRIYEQYYNEDKLTNNYLKLNLEKQKVKALQKSIRKSELKFEILKNAGRYLYENQKMVFHFIQYHEKIYSVRLMCETLGICRTTYRVWKNQILTETQKRKILLQNEIKTIFSNAKQRYGGVRITAELQNSGYQISNTTVSKYMKELGLSAKGKSN